MVRQSPPTLQKLVMQFMSEKPEFAEIAKSDKQGSYSVGSFIPH